MPVSRHLIAAMRTRYWVYLIASAVYLLSAVTLARLQQAGPQHADLELANGAPATLYLPNTGNVFFQSIQFPRVNGLRSRS